MKTWPVSFYVQRSLDFNTTQVPIPFDVVRLNVGSGMNAASGVFTAPRPGTYQFIFSTTRDAAALGLYVGLFVNSEYVGVSLGSGTSYPSFTLNAALALNAGDQVTLRIINDQPSPSLIGNFYTHFSGWLVDETLF